MNFSLKLPEARNHPIFFAITTLIVLFLSVTSLIVLIVSFGVSEIIVFPPEEFTLNWYYAITQRSYYVDAFLHSVFVATFNTVLAIPIGILTAYGLNRYDIRFESTIHIYLLLPFTIPLVVSGVILLIIYGEIGWMGELWAVGLALTIINIPFMIWSVSSSVNAFDPTLEDAAQSLGAEELQTFLYVTLPSLMPGVITGSLLMFMLGLNEFVVSLIVTTNETITLPVQIFSAIRGNISPEVAAISSVYVILAVFAIIIADRLIGIERFLYT